MKAVLYQLSYASEGEPYIGSLEPSQAFSAPLAPPEAGGGAGLCKTRHGQKSDEAFCRVARFEIGRPAHGEDPSASLARRRDRLKGLLIVVAAFAGCMVVSLWAKDATTPKPAPKPAPPTTERLAGFPNQVRPFDLLARAQELTERSIFRGFVAEGVKADGTMDFKARATRLRFSFQSPSGMGPQPVREGGTLPERSYCGKQSVRVGVAGISAMDDVPEVNCPRSRPVELKVPETCSIEQLWKLAEKRRIKPDLPARIEYYDAASGPAYRFVQKRKKGSPKRFVVSAKDCKTLYRGKKQRGSVP